MTQRVTEGAIVMVQGFEFVATNVQWSDETDQHDGTPTGRRRVLFTGTCTDNPRNDSIRATAYNGGTYGGNTFAGYVE
jgi:hypothetical protein